jgi:hypothetical protein
MTRREQLDLAARRATPSELEAMAQSKHDDIRAAASDERIRRAEERRTMGSLTGVVKPIDET